MCTRVCHSVHREGDQTLPWEDTSWADHPLGDTSWADTYSNAFLFIQLKLCLVLTLSLHYMFITTDISLFVKTCAIVYRLYYLSQYHTIRKFIRNSSFKQVCVPTSREGNVFTGVYQSVHNRPHGYWVTAHLRYNAVGTHPTGMLSCLNAFIFHQTFFDVASFRQKMFFFVAIVELICNS